jgi:phosphate transport system ATP-binding protein
MVDIMDTTDPGAPPAVSRPLPPRLEVTPGSRDAVADFDTMPSKLSVRNLDFFYGKQQALYANDLEIKEHRVTAIIGPSGCGKSTHLRCYNRIYELYRDQKATGEVTLDGQNILAAGTDLLSLRRRVGMIFQKPSPFPMTVFDNIAYGLRMHFKLSRSELSERVEDALKRGALWEEVKNKLSEPGLALSGGQQQRLCIARAIAAEPELILMDEPCSAIDPVGTAKIEELVQELKSSYTIALVTHNMQQAARVSDYTAFFFEGRIIEFGATTQIFENPARKQTEEYITGRFG